MNRRNILRLLLAMLISGVSAWKVSANGFGLPDQDAFATARGEAFVATADNPSAIYYNPAGITQLTSSNFRGGVYGIYLEPSYQSARQRREPHTYYSSDNFAAIPQFFYTYTSQGCAIEFWAGRLCAVRREHELAAGHGFPLGGHQRLAEIHHHQSGGGVESCCRHFRSAAV